MTWKVFVEENLAFDSLGLRIAKREQGGIFEVTELTLERRQEGVIRETQAAIHGPDTVQFMQAVMDAAYEYGLRPSKAQDERHLKEHLKDMREISRHLLKMEKKGQ